MANIYQAILAYAFMYEYKLNPKGGMEKVCATSNMGNVLNNKSRYFQWQEPF